MQNREAFRSCGASEACVVRHERIGIVPDAQRGGNVDRVECSKLTVFERRRSGNHWLVETNQRQAIDQRLSLPMSRIRPGGTPKRAVHLDSDNRCGNSVRPSIQRGSEGFRLRFGDDEFE